MFPKQNSERARTSKAFLGAQNYRDCNLLTEIQLVGVKYSPFECSMESYLRESLYL